MKFAHEILLNYGKIDTLACCTCVCAEIRCECVRYVMAVATFRVVCAHVAATLAFLRVHTCMLRT